MTEFESTAVLNLKLPDDEVQRIEDRLQNGELTVTPSASTGASGMGSGDAMGQLPSLAEDRNAILLDIRDELEQGGTGGGGNVGSDGIDLLDTAGKGAGVLGAGLLGTGATIGSLLGLEKFQQSQDGLVGSVTQALQDGIRNNPQGATNPATIPVTAANAAFADIGTEITEAAGDIDLPSPSEGFWPGLPEPTDGFFPELPEPQDDFFPGLPEPGNDFWPGLPEPGDNFFSEPSWLSDESLFDKPPEADGELNITQEEFSNIPPVSETSNPGTSSSSLPQDRTRPDFGSDTSTQRSKPPERKNINISVDSKVKVIDSRKELQKIQDEISKQTRKELERELTRGTGP